MGQLPGPCSFLDCTAHFLVLPPIPPNYAGLKLNAPFAVSKSKKHLRKD